MRLYIILLLLLFISIACAPVKFSRLKDETQKPRSDEPASEVTVHEVTMLEHYLMGDISRTYMIAWIFSDTEDFRGVIYDLHVEIANFDSLNQAQTDRILALEYDLNKMIHKFNDRNVFSRMYDVTASIFDKEFRDDDYTLSVSPQKLESDGVDARAISDSTNGVVNSILQNGFTFQEVDLLCQRSCNLSDYLP